MTNERQARAKTERTPQEKLSNPELPSELVEGLTKTFIARTDCYPLQRPNGAYFSVKRPLTPHLIEAHLHGTVTLGTYALDTDSQARWLCFDADEIEQWAALRHMAHQLEQESIFAALELSRRGGHCWLFFEPLSGETARRFGRQLLEQYGVGKLELYPKQDRLMTGVGSLVRLPFGVHRKTGKRYPFITPDGDLLAPTIQQQLALLAAPFQVPHSYIERTLAKARPSSPPEERSFPKATGISGEYVSARLKSAVSVQDFVSRFVQLDQRGKGLCPFHDDRIQSFQVNDEQNYWSCYAGCGGGSIIDFWMQWRAKHGQDASFAATVRDLAAILLPNSAS